MSTISYSNPQAHTFRVSISIKAQTERFHPRENAELGDPIKPILCFVFESIWYLSSKSWISSLSNLYTLVRMMERRKSKLCLQLHEHMIWFVWRSRPSVWFISFISLLMTSQANHQRAGLFILQLFRVESRHVHSKIPITRDALGFWTVKLYRKMEVWMPVLPNLCVMGHACYAATCIFQVNMHCFISMLW